MDTASATGYKSALLRTKKDEIDLLNKVLTFKGAEVGACSYIVVCVHHPVLLVD